MTASSRWILALSLFASPALAAPQQGPGARPPEFSSPEVKEDRTVVVRLFAPEADEVRFSSSDLPSDTPFGRGVAMTKDDRGVWEATLGPVPPGSYRYTFQVDGIPVVDPRNPTTSESNMNTWSLVTVPGSPVSDLKDVPHGAVAEVHYRSESLDRFRRMHVYTPPGYESGEGEYPVLYLLHGATDSDASWSSVGRAGLVLDNLIAAGEAEPMIVVMPMGHTGPFSFGPGGSSFERQMEEFVTDFIADVRPLVERTYRVSDDRRHRAIAGLSMGGAQTLEIAMRQLADYGYVGVFSSGVFGLDRQGPGGGGDARGPSWQQRHQAALDDPDLRDGLHLLWFATGREDFLLNTTRATVDLFKEKGFDVTFEETDGGHTWINWREHYLPDFARQLFR
ncbi:alpha/beta hydrolase-fold protein [Tautonia sociabilis]|uniref:Esterase n=1 Tax=Tautonia sociabilis TaxID=2080755 RepID=A0A432MHJ8_9BACT|nr:alpha/beta hydrolase-fold protein [Tautonia sociabilis]RUL86282.1 esterase [Tautonia sociabilis]